MAGITIGPFSFPAALLVVFGAVGIALAVGHAVSGPARGRAERLFWAVLAASVLAARAAFVARYWSAYSDAPLQALDMRDGGFDAVAGSVAGLAVAAILAWRNPAERKAVLAATLAGAVAWAGGNALAALAAPVRPLPDMTLSRLAGGDTNLRAFQGRPVVINLWASWCPPCRREMPALARAQRLHPEAVFVFVNQGEPADAVRRYLHDQGLALDNVLLDAEGRLAKETGSPGLPTTLFFGAGGRLVDQRVGELSSATLAQRLQALVAGPKQPASPL